MPETNPDAVRLLSDDEVAEIAARANVATQGDWTIRGASWVDGGLRLAGYGVRFADDPFDGHYTGWDARTNFPPETPEGAQASADRQFLAHAREDVPALCATVRALRDWRESAMTLLNRYENLAESFGGKPGSLRVENLERGVAALREQLATLQKPRMFPIQRGVPVRWELAEKAYATYSRLFGEDQSLERLAQRGGFGVEEFACLYLGHDPRCANRKQCAATVEDEIGFIAQLQSQLAQMTQERWAAVQALKDVRRIVGAREIGADTEEWIDDIIRKQEQP